MDAPNFKLPDYFINRELSQLAFNQRVLDQAVTGSNPLLERLKFLCIVSTNLDEFFEVRVAGLKQRQERGNSPPGPDMMSPGQVLDAVSTSVHELIADQYRCLNDSLIPALAEEGIRFIRRQNWSTAQRAWLHQYFHDEIEPLLSPISLDSARPFPRILNKSLNFIVALEGTHAFGRPCRRAIVQAPRSLPRLIRLPNSLPETGDNDYVFLSSILHAFVEELFTGMEIMGCYQFRVTRNSDLYIDDEEVDDLVRALEGELISSRYNAAVRLEVAHDCPDDLSHYLLDRFSLTEEDLFRVEGPVNLNRLMTVYSMVDRPDLKDPPFVPGNPHPELSGDSLFRSMSKREYLLHHPYESFAPVLDFITSASRDPDVLAIKMTLYRTGSSSPFVDALVAAAQAGKEVTVLVELRARFDEADNIALANRLQEAGAHVVYGIVGFKTHCKMALVVRREKSGLKRYVHLGTGNYHQKTARLYTDYGFFTTDPEICEDVHHVFLQLTSMMENPPLNRLYQSPFNLHDNLLRMIENEIDSARNGGTGHIIAKMNALVEPQIIQALYKASCAGVFVDLVVRGVCSLRPGVPGISENIRVRSIIGRFLEHSRVYYFYNGGQQKVFISSADWMDRNLHRRVETCTPIADPVLKKRIITDLDRFLSDTEGAWELQENGEYVRAGNAEGQPKLSVQGELLEQLATDV